MARSKVPPDHEYDESGKCKWCPATRYPDPPADPIPGQNEDMGSAAPSARTGDNPAGAG